MSSHPLLPCPGATCKTLYAVKPLTNVRQDQLCSVKRERERWIVLFLAGVELFGPRWLNFHVYTLLFINTCVNDPWHFSVRCLAQRNCDCKNQVTGLFWFQCTSEYTFCVHVRSYWRRSIGPAIIYLHIIPQKRTRQFTQVTFLFTVVAMYIALFTGHLAYECWDFHRQSALGRCSIKTQQWPEQAWKRPPVAPRHLRRSLIENLIWTERLSGFSVASHRSPLRRRVHANPPIGSLQRYFALYQQSHISDGVFIIYLPLTCTLWHTADEELFVCVTSTSTSVYLLKSLAFL